MAIVVEPKTGMFYLHTPKSSYVMQIVDGKYLAQVYWGKRISGGLEHHIAYASRPSFSPLIEPEQPMLSLDTLPQVYPAYGTGDYRQPAIEMETEQGYSALELHVVTYETMKGKPKLPGLPATYVEQTDEADTLEMTLADSTYGLEVKLQFTVYNDRDVITRSASILNRQSTPLKLNRVLSASIDFHHNQFELVTLSGTWGDERQLQRNKLVPGIQGIGSARGASSHVHNPFAALVMPEATETQGDVYGFSLVYSGNFIAQVELSQYGTTRFGMGIQPFDFAWRLEAGETFQTPEAVLVYSAHGLGEMSRTYHRLYRERLARGQHRDAIRPIKVNNWEATYFDFDAEKLREIGQVASKCGIEMFVLDDGWFGKRDDDRSSLGDWFEHRSKLPEGLEGVARSMNEMNLRFGLWFEPEMISPNSELYREHPDWCLHIPNRRRSEGRCQLILDYSRSEVCEYIYTSMSDILRRVPVDYIKWDMNRNMTEIGSAALPAERQRETAHRYLLNLYQLLERLTHEFPHILFESCSGGGGRFDPGMLYYMPQTWTSDNTDAIARLKIQYGTSMVYPSSSMAAHVSAVPNHQLRRITPLSTRGNVAMAGVLGYELDMTVLSAAEQAEVMEQVERYKSIRSIVQFGDLYRLVSPFETNASSWMHVSADQTAAVWVYCVALSRANGPIPYVRMQGLHPDWTYRVCETGMMYKGDELMNAGIAVPLAHGDFASVMWRLEAVQ